MSGTASQTLSVTVTANASGLKAEINGAKAAVDDLGKATATSAAQATAATKTTSAAIGDQATIAKATAAAAKAAAAEQAAASKAAAAEEKAATKAAATERAALIKTQAEAEKAAAKAIKDAAGQAAKAEADAAKAVATAEKAAAKEASEAVEAAEKGKAAAAKVAAATQAAAHKEATSGANQQAFAMRQLGVQSIQAFSGIATGMPVMTVLIQQGHQVLDVALSTGSGFGLLKAAGEKLAGAFGALISPMGLTVGGLVATGAVLGLAVAHSIEMEAQQRALSVALRGTGRDAVVSTAAMQGYIQALQRQGLDSTTATESVLKLARTQGLSGEAIKSVVGLSGDLAATLGTDVPGAIDKLVEAFTGGYDGVKKLDDALNFLTASQRQQIRMMLESGNAAGAMKVQVSALGATIKGAREAALTPLQRALEDVRKSWNDFMADLSKSSLVNAVMAGVTSAAEAVAASVTKISNAQEIARLQAALAAKTDNGDPVIVGGDVAVIQAEIRRRQASHGTANAQAEAMLAGGPITGGADTSAADKANAKEAERVAKIVADLNKVYADEIELLKVSLPLRAQRRAEMEAEARILGLNIDANAALEVKTKAMEAARKAEADARAQELQQMDLEVTAALHVADAVGQGRSAMAVAAAAAEAYAKAQTQGGVAELAFAQAILDRAAAQVLAQASNQAVELEEAAKGAHDLAEATARGFGAEHAAELEERISAATAQMRALAAATTDPRLQTALNKAADGFGTNTRSIDASNQSRTLSKMGLAQDQEAETLAARGRLAGAGWQQRDSELADLKAKQDIERQGLDINDQAAIRYRAQARAIAMTTQEVQAQEAAWQAVGDIGKQAFQAVGQQISNDISQGTLGFKTLEKVGLQVANTLIQKFAELAIINPLLNSLGLGSSKLPVFGDILEGLGFGATDGGLKNFAPNTPIDTWFTPTMHTGGTVGSASAMRDVPASIFAGARRFHTGGGIGASEVPIIAQLGEHVVTAKQGAAIAGSLGGVSQVINFYGNAGSDQDRKQLAELVRQAADSAVSARAPGIAAAAQAGIISQAGRGGRVSQQLGRR